MPDAGVIVDIEVVTGEEADFARMSERLDALEITLGRRPGTVTADKAYGIGKVYAAQSERPSRSGPVGAAHYCRDPAPTFHAPSQGQRLSHPALPL